MAYRGAIGNQRIKNVIAFKALFEKDIGTLLLIEVMYVIKRDLLGFIGSQEDCMQKIRDLNQELKKSSAFKPFQDRRTDFVAYGGAMQSKVLWFIGS